MNRTIKEATVKRVHYDSHEHLKIPLNDFMAAYNCRQRPKTLSGLTPYEYVCKIWTSEPKRLIINPTYQTTIPNARAYIHQLVPPRSVKFQENK